MNIPESEKNDLYRDDDNPSKALEVISAHHKEHHQSETEPTNPKVEEVAREIIPDKPVGFGAPNDDGEGDFIAQPTPKHKPGPKPNDIQPGLVEVDDAQHTAANITDITPAAAAEIESDADQQRNGNPESNPDDLAA